ncbi:MAG TPA: YetF domain-containing protein [Burkholderiales bacterium]|nr:YetF domain-containing protein [Burkholderiales bacterium]
MLQEILEAVRELVALGDSDLSAWQMALRAIIIYLTAIVLVKVGQKRFMGKNTAFDMILGIILGSVLSRAITGNADLLPTITAGATLVALHWLFSVTSFHFSFFGTFIKGREKMLIRDGEINWDNMRKSHLSRHDLEMALRSSGQVTEPEDVKLAYFERSGDISVIPREKSRALRVVEVSVTEGVQRVRIELAQTG